MDKDLNKSTKPNFDKDTQELLLRCVDLIKYTLLVSSELPEDPTETIYKILYGITGSIVGNRNKQKVFELPFNQLWFAVIAWANNYLETKYYEQKEGNEGSTE